MSRIATTTFWILLLIFASPSISFVEEWNTFATLWGDEPICENGAVDLVLVQPDGLDVSRKRLDFCRPCNVSPWNVGDLKPGKFLVDAIVTGCDGARQSVHQIETVVTGRDLSKTIGFYLYNWDGLLEFLYLAVHSEFDATGRFEAASAGFETQFKYVGRDPIHPCTTQGRVILEYMVEGTWRVVMASRWYDWNERPELIRSGQELPVSLGWTPPKPPSFVRPVKPTAKRLKVDVVPMVTTTNPQNVKGSPSLPWCDTLVASLPLQDGEPTFYLLPLEPKVPNLEPALETED